MWLSEQAASVRAGVPYSPTLRRRAGNAEKRGFKAQRLSLIHIFVLQKHSRLANSASLHCTGRDIPDRTLKLEFGEEDHVWKLLEDSKTCSGASRISTLRIENLLSELLQKESEISAPAKALLEKIDPAGSEDWTPNSFSHQIRKSVDTLR